MSLSQINQRRFFRLGIDARFYILFLALQMLSVGIFYFLAYIDNLNMLHNGYVSKQSITFRMTSIHQPLRFPEQDYLLMQYNPVQPQLKIVRISGDIKLPPLQSQSDRPDDIDKWNTEARIGKAFIGDKVNPRYIPEGYVFAGQFDIPADYQLSTQQWLFPASNKVSLADGELFVMSSPNSNTMDLVQTFSNHNPIELVHTEFKGTYALLSNQWLVHFLWVVLIFTSCVAILIMLYWLRQERAFIRICNEYGCTFWQMYIHMLVYKLSPLIVASFVMVLLCTSIFQTLVQVWGRHWQLQSWYMVGVFSLLIILITFVITCCYSTRSRRVH